MNKIIDSIKKSYQNLAKNTKLMLLCSALVMGLVLVFSSSLLENNKDKTKTEDKTITRDEFISNTEAKLTEVFSMIEGVGKCRVILTLENGEEYIYAQKVKESYNSSDDVNTRKDSENEYIIIDDKNGGETALIVTQIEPKIKGAVIVMEGASNYEVVEKVIDAATKLLGVSTNKISIAKMK